MNMSGNGRHGSASGDIAPCGHPVQPGRRFCTVCGRPVPGDTGADYNNPGYNSPGYNSPGDSSATQTVARPARRGQPLQPYQPEQPYQREQPYQPEQPHQREQPPLPLQDWQRQEPPQDRQPPHGQPPREPGRHVAPGARRPRWPVIAGIALGAVILGAGGGAYALVEHPFSHPGTPSADGSNAVDSSQLPASPSGTGQSATASATPASTGTPTPTPSPSTSEQQAATALAGLLSQSSSDRTAIQQAYNDVSNCGPQLSQDQQTFQNAATSRQGLIRQLSKLPGAAALPAAMLSDLSGAWQASEQADQDYAQWASDQSANGCMQQAYSDPAYTAAATPNNQATADKASFTALWNPIAQQYGLTTYNQGDL